MSDFRISPQRSKSVQPNTASPHPNRDIEASSNALRAAATEPVVDIDATILEREIALSHQPSPFCDSSFVMSFNGVPDIGHFSLHGVSDEQFCPGTINRLAEIRH